MSRLHDFSVEQTCSLFKITPAGVAVTFEPLQDQNEHQTVSFEEDLVLLFTSIVYSFSLLPEHN